MELENMKEDSVEVVDQYFKDLRAAFFTGKTQKLDWRKKQLDQLQLAFEELSDEINLALKLDLGREEFTSWFLEISTITSQIKFDKSGIDTWTKPSKRDTPVALAPA